MKLPSNKKRWRYIRNSNLIEEIQIDEKRYVAYDKSPYPEICGHALALEYMLEHYEEPLSQEHIFRMHGHLMQNLVSPKYRGAYRDVPVWIGGHKAMPAIAIRPAMEDLIKYAGEVKTEEDCWKIHHEFETIHPFIDGNGRTGRLILNWMLLHNSLPFRIIDITERWTYYEAIQEYQRSRDDKYR